MKKHLDGLPEQILEGFKLGARLNVPSEWKKIKNIVFCGMGGSAIGGDVIRALMDHRGRIPFYVNREDSLPSWAGRETLAVLSSYSGDTLETRRALEDAVRKNCRLLILTSGGYFLEFSSRRKVACLRVPSGMPPRCAIGYLCLPVLPVFNKAKWLRVAPSDIREAASAVQAVSKARAKDVARRLKDRHVFLYGPSAGLEPVVKRWRAQLAENAKVIASHHCLPEMFHNEIEGRPLPRSLRGKSAAVFFRTHGSPAWLEKKTLVAKKIISEHGAEIINIQAPSRGILGRIFGLISLGDWVSYELARLNGVDPVAIPAISRIKKVPGP